MRPLSVKPLIPAFGAEILDVDLSNDLDAATIAGVQEAIGKYGLLLFRAQKNSPTQLKNLAASLARLEPHPARQKYSVKGCEDLIVVSNGMNEAGEPIGLVDIGQFWHTDGSYLPVPYAYTVLQGIEIPTRDGKALGDTLFASTTAAYDALPEATKTRLQGLKSVHSYSYRMAERRRTATGKFSAAGTGAPDVIHPVILDHPVTGRKVLFLDEGYCCEIVGMPREEGQALLKELFAHMVKPQFVYRHNWRQGDVLIWDNVVTLHNAVKDYEASDLRLMHRAATKFRSDWVPGVVVNGSAGQATGELYS